MILSIQQLDFQWQTQDPFLFCAFHNDAFPKGNQELGPDSSLAHRRIGMDFEIRDGWRMYHGEKIPGFPMHPHRGFETITIVEQGLVDHADSLGAAGRYGEGDVQWMTAGRGVQHSEMFPLLNTQEKNPLLLFQVWLNLPSKSKLVDPHFTMFWADKIPLIEEQDANGALTKISLIAGKYKEVEPLAPPPSSWAADYENEVAVLRITMAPKACWQLPESSANVNRTLYFFSGESITLADQPLQVLHSAQLDQQSMQIVNTGEQTAQLLLLQGKPINEPVAQHGPFVMNTREELVEAFEDYQKDQFGGWPWPRNDQVHGQRARFARYAQGNEEEPEN